MNGVIQAFAKHPGYASQFFLKSNSPFIEGARNSDRVAKVLFLIVLPVTCDAR